MKIKAIQIPKRFIPKWNGNKDLSPNEQVIITFKEIPGTSEKSHYKNFAFATSGGVELKYNDSLLVSAYVEKIENLEIGDEVIRTGARLAKANAPGLTDLFTEIRDYLFPDDELSEGESEA